MKLNVSSKTNNSQNKQPIKYWLATFLLTLATFFPAIAYAGVASFISDIFQEKVSASTVSFDLTDAEPKTATLLQAAINIDPNPNKGEVDTTIVSGNSLLSEAGPAGTLVDVQDVPENMQISTYVVHQGDSLAAIAKLFNVSVNTIVWANDLSKSVPLKEGQTLIILPISGIQHKVKSGETLQGIATRYKADIDEILKYNDLTLATILATGDILTIPDAEPIASINKTATVSIGTKTAPAGYYTRPIKGGIRSQSIHGNNGVDLASPVGTPIYAAASGKVIVSATGGWNGGYGNYVVISHPNGTQTLYGHNNSNVVKAGSYVKKGEIIAYVGSTGKSTGPHVHFEIRGAKNPF